MCKGNPKLYCDHDVFFVIDDSFFVVAFDVQREFQRILVSMKKFVACTMVIRLARLLLEALSARETKFRLTLSQKDKIS